MEIDEVVWNHAVHSKNRERLLNEEIAELFFQRVLERARPYMSDEHFAVDGTLIAACMSVASRMSTSFWRRRLPVTVPSRT